MKDAHHSFLKECFRLAEVSSSHGESSVGAVVVKDGEILGEGTEQSRSRNDVTRHAEVVAILDAIERHGPTACNGASLYTNVEPCILCAYVIRHHRISRVLYVRRAGDVGSVHSHYPILRANHIKQWGAPPEIIELPAADLTD